MKLKSKFSEHDLERIKAAVKTAEEKISGEIVPVIVERSGSYGIANYKAGLMSASVAFVLMIILDRYVIADTHTFFYDPLFIFFVVSVVGVLGGLLPNLSDGLKRVFIAQAELDFNTRQRAENAFLEEEVFNTRQRTGIMIFISFFEHEVMVIADKGINKAVEQKQWDKIVADLVTNIKAGRMVDGLEQSIKQCGDLLLEKGFTKSDDDINELRDDLRLNK